ncbi:MAG: penicillin-binding protein 2 [Candidatus Kapaibacterium sp.]|jgi:penicillin-binding protein 2
MPEIFEHEFASPLRVRIFSAIIAVVFVGFLVRFVELQIVQGDALRDAAVDQGLKKIERIPVRGAIYDRHGRVIAASVPSYSVALTPQDFIPYKKTSLPVLAKILGVDTSTILDKIRAAGFYTRFQPIKIWRDADPRIIAAIEENHEKLPGIDIVFESKREYVAPIRASHLLGYTKEIDRRLLDKKAESADSDYYHSGDVIGTTGLEAIHEQDLRGTKGYEFLAVDARGQKQSRLNNGLTDLNSIDGSNIQLGMDIDVQEYAEQLLDPYHGAVVALDPNNGDILALVSKPDFDLDLFSGKTTKAEYQSVMLDPSYPLYNRALQTRYPPGSTWKPMMAAAGLTTKTIGLDYRINCPGYFTFGNHTYNDDAVHGLTDIHSSISRSCDVFYYQLVLKLGIDSMYKYARIFGFDTATGVDIGNEGNGMIPNTQRMNRLYPHGWTKGYVVSQGIGQGEIGVTPIQQAVYASVWANHGLWVQPHAAKNIYNVKTGKWDSVAYRTRKLPIPDTVIEVVRKGMYGVVNEPGGTAYSTGLLSPELKIAGKTGTAQNPHGDNHAWFICFAPYDHPKIAICVMLENAGFGGRVAAPIARKLIKLYLTGKREDPEPAILPNTPEYEARKAARFAEGTTKKATLKTADSLSALPKKPTTKPPTTSVTNTRHAELLDPKRTRR